MSYTGETVKLNGHARAVDPQAVPLVAGRPSKIAEERQRTGTWGYKGLLPRTTYKDYRARERSNVYDTLRNLIDRDPDASQAANTYVLFCLQGYANTALNADGTPDTAGTALLHDMDARVGTEYGGGADQLHTVYVLSLIAEGAMAGELELTPDLRDIVDAHPVRPTKINCQREEGTGRLMYGIGTGKQFVELSPRQFRYIPYQPYIDDPYGRPMFLPAIAPIFAKIEFMEDLRDVIHHQAWPRWDFEIAEAAVIAGIEAIYPGLTATQKAEKMASAFEAIQTALLALEPTQNPVHYDSVKINELLVANGLPDLEGIMATLDSQIVTGLKMLDVFLNRNAGSTTTHATVQARAFALMVAAIQRMLKRYWEWVGTTRLQLAGRQSRAHVEFELLQVVDRLLEANAEGKEIANWVAVVDQGWAAAKEASNALLGHDPVGEPKPQPAAEPEEETDEPDEIEKEDE